MEQQYEINALADMIIKFEYVWLDGYDPKNIRMKTRYENWKLDMSQGGGFSREEVLKRCPDWYFDGSSTNQAPADDSDLILRPVKVYHNPLEESDMPSFIVLCDVLNADGVPVESNTRSLLKKALEDSEIENPLFAVEQEYFIRDAKTNKILGLGDESESQGRYYCGVGANLAFGRRLSDIHSQVCHQMRLPICGTNAEVAPGQWEYQLKEQDPISTADDLWISRYLLMKVAENLDCYVDFSPKPIKGDWNGSGAHINFSTKEMMEEGGASMFERICHTLRLNHEKHIEKYGKENELRLTGKHETQSIDKFTWGQGDRGASIRIPVSTLQNKWKGHIEDRRPSSNVDPYEAFSILIESLNKVEEVTVSQSN